jgi:hypothetical protein
MTDYITGGRNENLAYKNAVEVAKRWGWHVFPVHTAERVADDAPVECSCQRPNCTQMGKHPRTRNGLKDATDDLEQLATWHRQWPDANWAVRTGPESGIWAIDWDGDEGLANRRALIKELEASLGDTRQVRSGGGGLHDIYAWPADDTVIPNNSRKLASAADIRGKGGYILLPGSGHKSGRVYEVVSDVEPKQAPTSLVTRVLQTSKAAGSGPTAAMIPEGQRNDALTSEAGKLRRIGFDTPEIDAALKAVNGRRCNPPLPITEVSKIAASVGKYPAGNGTVPSSL